MGGIGAASQKWALSWHDFFKPFSPSFSFYLFYPYRAIPTNWTTLVSSISFNRLRYLIYSLILMITTLFLSWLKPHFTLLTFHFLSSNNNSLDPTMENKTRRLDSESSWYHWPISGGVINYDDEELNLHRPGALHRTST